ncbi:hypothetical protein B9Z55_018709 [Caenorhabditis nigoni]|uniref:C-type lectin domain-containing protein n=1 Tax=Caenorhabditis nigoni TaxID=1611254 RepID=A0A2G5TFE5_9PELO|nr:hypothetical protein B9Z55_018709 [Caenorhabditis nigoni]
MSGKLFLFLLFGAVFLIEGMSRSPMQMDVAGEESCEEDDGEYDSQGRPTRVGAPNPNAKPRKADDDWDGVEDPTDEDYLRYENTNQEGICILERGKCPSGEWRMFKRRNESVCLKIFGTVHKIDARTAADICRANHNARMMTVDSQAEREWIYTTELGGNISYPYMFVAGYRSRRCKNAPCTVSMDAFEEVDRTADHKFIYSRWEGIYNEYHDLEFSNCLAVHVYPHPLSLPNFIRDFSCKQLFLNTVLCGVTVIKGPREGAPARARSLGPRGLKLWSSGAGALELELWSWSSGAGALELELWSWSSGAGALELELWSWSSGAGALELELWSWSSGAGALELELWSWSSGAGALELELWSWSSGAGALELELWSWSSGAGALELELWSWSSGAGALELELWSWSSGAGALELELWSWSSGAGALELELWSWSSGAGALELELWSWSSGAGALELELWSWSSGAGALDWSWSWSSGAGALELELWSWSSGAGALELELWSWSSGAGALELELWSWSSGAGALELELWSWSSGAGALELELWGGAGALELELWSWSSGAGALELELWSWSSGAGALELELWSWSSGAGALELELWSWSSGAGALELELWSWSSGAGALELELWSWIFKIIFSTPGTEIRQFMQKDGPRETRLFGAFLMVQTENKKEMK